jgi:peptidoglycan hydrolase-like protein with peptidoglycan-binding domain
MRVEDVAATSLVAGWSTWLLGLVMRRPKDVIGITAAAAAMIAIAVNALYLQKGPHPAPMFATKTIRALDRDAVGSVRPILPRPRPAHTTNVPTKIGVLRPAAVPVGDSARGSEAAPRSQLAIVTDIQRELVRRGYYDGTVDGLYGPKTDAAIRDFEQAAGIKASGVPSEAVLKTITHSPIRARGAATTNDAVAKLLAPSSKLMAVQRALTEFGYGQIAPTGVFDPDTKAAIERFERERNLPVTGQPSDRVARELSAVTGRPLD